MDVISSRAKRSGRSTLHGIGNFAGPVLHVSCRSILELVGGLRLQRVEHARGVPMKWPQLHDLAISYSEELQQRPVSIAARTLRDRIHVRLAHDHVAVRVEL